MKKIEELRAELANAEAAFRAVKALLWNASEMRQASMVFRLNRQLDRAVGRMRKARRALSEAKHETF